MATRSGTIDPGLVLWLQREGGLGVDEVNDGLEHDSGMKALGGTSDQAQLLSERLTATGSRSPPSRSTCTGSCASRSMVVLGGVDALAFTGGVERTP